MPEAGNPFRALVVDDEPMVRNLTIRALHREGLSCDAATDGCEAKEKIASHDYDVVVTDLKMPKMHGHALVCELLASGNRPVVVILTGLLEPKLARDLLARGVDGIEFKPVDYDLLAAKVKALAARQRERLEEEKSGVALCGGSRSGIIRGAPNASGLEASDIEGKLVNLSKILPVSQAAFDVYSMTGSDSYQPSQIAAAIARDASLTVDVLRLANSSFYNPSATKIVELHEAVARIGQKRIGELALATSALGAITANVIPWINTDLTWRRSVAAGAAIDLLLERGQLPEAAEGLFLSAIMYPLGRLILGMLYPQEYQRITALCKNGTDTMEDHEEQAFPLTHSQVMGSLLKTWNIPGAIYEPLWYMSNGYFSLASLPEPLRTKVELLKLSTLVGSIAVGGWDSWDRLDFPPAPVLRRLGIESLSTTIRETQSDFRKIVDFRPKGSVVRAQEDDSAKPTRPSGRLTYCNLSTEPVDFLAEVISSMRMEVRTREPNSIEACNKLVINCIWNPLCRQAARITSQFGDGSVLIVTDQGHAKAYSRLGEVLSLPMSYGRLRLACEKLSEDLAIGAPLEASR